jgi:hypothetical protein
MQPTLTKLAVLIVLGATALIAGGCGGQKFTRVNYETIYLGQPADAVEEKLGEPTERSRARWLYVNDQPWYQAVIEFDNGKVIDKRWWWTRP